MSKRTFPTPPETQPGYPASDSAALYGDPELYARLNTLVEKSRGNLTSSENEKAAARAVGELVPVENFEIPIRSGKAWVVRQICTLSTPYGPQVGDLNIFSLSNPREHFWAARTRQLHASHLKIGDRLWSQLPYLRPLCTVVGDSLKEYGVDERGGRVHDLLGTRFMRGEANEDGGLDVILTVGWVVADECTVNRLLANSSFDYHCHSNLVRAVIPYGLNESDVHDVLNVFQVTGLDKDGRYFMSPSPAKPGDYFSFFAETDLLCALSVCPGGDLSVYGWGEDAQKRMLDTCRPLGVEVHSISNETKDEVLKGWKESEVAFGETGYAGMHGLKAPVWGQ
ncbi:hypothetical protein HYFRA_00008850 [Hymenoscyphus fraxineus]|uniref:DUF1989 domain-containing protein n=1 Tax=Hymenoscyphus fraxineus TaxID=746836 RepID=A0A9N9KY46_9HELO|nr:hypothetical protein HYFRA_00008850 [Hymenoscyphus fraxineus]